VAASAPPLIDGSVLSRNAHGADAGLFAAFARSTVMMPATQIVRGPRY